MKRINLITTCTNGKRSNGHNALNLADYSAGQISSSILVKSWCSALHQALLTSKTIVVEDLYKGGHWSTAKQMIELYNLDLWVLSAGLGLLHSKQKVVPYNATFSSGYPESIPLFSKEYNGRSFYRSWWKGLTENSPFKDANHPTISALMQNRPCEFFIICGSPDYISAIEVDLMNGIEYLKDPQKQLLIITSKGVSPRLSQYLLKTDNKIAKYLGCNMLMLNIGLARHFVGIFTEKNEKNFRLLANQLGNEFEKLPEVLTIKGIKRTPIEVESFILSLMKKHTSLSATKALREFRDSGNSFEEKRFRQIFIELEQNHD